MIYSPGRQSTREHYTCNTPSPSGARRTSAPDGDAGGEREPAGAGGSTGSSEGRQSLLGDLFAVFAGAFHLLLALVLRAAQTAFAAVLSFVAGDVVEADGLTRTPRSPANNYNDDDGGGGYSSDSSNAVNLIPSPLPPNHPRGDSFVGVGDATPTVPSPIVRRKGSDGARRQQRTPVRRSKHSDKTPEEDAQFRRNYKAENQKKNRAKKREAAEAAERGISDANLYNFIASRQEQDAEILRTTMKREKMRQESERKAREYSKYCLDTMLALKLDSKFDADEEREHE